jgi:hypothetical protein
MTADQNMRPSISQLCQFIADVLIGQIDFLRGKTHVLTSEIKQLRERLRQTEVPTNTGFKGFSTIEAN